MLGRVALATIVAALVAGILLPGSTATAAVTIGEDTSGVGTGDYNCVGNPCTLATLQHPSRPLIVPFDGVIVRWRVQGAGLPAPITPRVVRPFPGGTFTGAGIGTPETIVAGAERTIPTRLVVQQGDLFGLDISQNGGVRFSSGPAGASWGTWTVPQLADGGAGRVPISNPDESLLYNADVEPDCDRDAFGDETQDADTSTCRASAAVKGKVKVKGGPNSRLVVLTGIDVACPDGLGTCTGTAAVQRASGSKRLASVSKLPKRLGKKKLSVAAGKTQAVKVKLTKKASNALRDKGKLKVKISVKLAAPGGGDTAIASRVAKLKPPS